MKIVFTIMLLILVSIAAQACPICNSATGKQVRASLLGPDLGFNLAASIAPFAIFALITFLIYKGGHLPFLLKNKEVV